MRKIPFAGIELTSQRVRRLRGANWATGVDRLSIRCHFYHTSRWCYDGIVLHRFVLWCGMKWNNITPGSSGSPPLLRQRQRQHGGHGFRSGAHPCRGWDAPIYRVHQESLEFQALETLLSSMRLPDETKGAFRFSHETFPVPACHEVKASTKSEKVTCFLLH